jgi:hypothetical protein
MKRSKSTLRGSSEQRLDDRRAYDIYIKEQKQKPSVKSERIKPHSSASVKPIILLRDPSAGDARHCYECECANSQGYCDNYLLYAVMRGKCMELIEGVDISCKIL